MNKEKSYLFNNKECKEIHAYFLWKDEISKLWNFEMRNGDIQKVKEFNQKYSEILFSDDEEINNLVGSWVDFNV